MKLKAVGFLGQAHYSLHKKEIDQLIKQFLFLSTMQSYYYLNLDITGSIVSIFLSVFSFKKIQPSFSVLKFMHLVYIFVKKES